MWSILCSFNWFLIPLIVNQFLYPNSAENQLTPFDDKTLFSISWVYPEDISFQLFDNKGEFEELQIRTLKDEAFTCYIPILSPEEVLETNEFLEKQHRISINEILDPLTEIDSCFYKIEGYWTYEICHGKSLRQFHESEDTALGKKQQKVVTEYILGYYKSPPNFAVDLPLPTLKYNNQNYAYFEITMSGGTNCEILQGTARKTIIRYICHPNGNHVGFIHIEETSSCHYTVIFGSSHLCDLSEFVVEKSMEHIIHCVPTNFEIRSGIVKPKDLIDMESEISEEYSQTEPLDNSEKSVGKGKSAKPISNNMVSKILSGALCLQGGSKGWWKYEFCFGKYVKQFHLDEKSSDEIILGTWNAEAHRLWFENNKDKKKLISQSYFQHYYTNGDVCDITGKSRNVIVKMKCSASASQEQVIMFLEENLTCEYVLTVETVAFCLMLQNLDEFGMTSE